MPWKWPDIVTNTYEGDDRRDICPDAECNDPMRFHSEDGCTVPGCLCKRPGAKGA